MLYNIMLDGSDTWQIKIEYVTIPDRIDARMAGWMCNVRSENVILVMERRNGLQLNTTTKHLKRNDSSEFLV